jgi:hypothetical protein
MFVVSFHGQQLWCTEQNFAGSSQKHPASGKGQDMPSGCAEASALPYTILMYNIKDRATSRSQSDRKVSPEAPATRRQKSRLQAAQAVGSAGW